MRVLAGPGLDSLVPITDIVNTGASHSITSDLFEGEVAVNIKGFTDPDGHVLDSEYFNREERKGVTWSIQVQGKFLQTYSADDILFGNTFDKPLKLPWGSGAALKFMKFVDPTMDHDLASPTKPWALSPLISTMPYFAHAKMNYNDDKSSLVAPFPAEQSLMDDTSQLTMATVNSLDDSPASSASSSSSSLSSATSSTSTTSSKKMLDLGRKKKEPRMDNLTTAAARRSYFHETNNRRKVIFGPEDVITTDFCYGFLEFSPGLSLRLPGGVSFDLMKYWDGQPVRFVCCERKNSPNSDVVNGDSNEDPWGRIFWCIAIEPAFTTEDENVAQGVESA
ncbi:hypothetical protein SERLA73DRAFT_46390 [Serpula lacrymans var. lacrymans S7.3]|uniref:Domain of unknown function at the cortex 1 domain-containing protein n=1 Tax=Serpula lacrymans var. lacrymans (strain S7.3) TaxID=936435 RepID=F8PJD7_SERL3|nr:hypothetical protein SERLA73DRAFT_46390 [Serpula lacrymans var. lacrymans S7.3]